MRGDESAANRRGRSRDLSGFCSCSSPAFRLCAPPLDRPRERRPVGDIDPRARSRGLARRSRGLRVHRVRRSARRDRRRRERLLGRVRRLFDFADRRGPDTRRPGRRARDSRARRLLDGCARSGRGRLRHRPRPRRGRAALGRDRQRGPAVPSPSASSSSAPRSAAASRRARRRPRARGPGYRRQEGRTRLAALYLDIERRARSRRDTERREGRTVPLLVLRGTRRGPRGLRHSAMPRGQQACRPIGSASRAITALRRPTSRRASPPSSSRGDGTGEAPVRPPSGRLVPDLRRELSRTRAGGFPEAWDRHYFIFQLGRLVAVLGRGPMSPSSSASSPW